MDPDRPDSAATPGAIDAATASESTLGQLMALLDAGGPVVLILLGLSVIMVATAMIKLAQFLRLGVWRRAAAEQALASMRRGRIDEAIVAAGSAKGVAAGIVSFALRDCRRGEAAVADLRSEAVRRIDETAERLRGNLRILEVIASLAPLLGLFGTVLGMIDAFQNLEHSGARADPAILSGGIWAALLTTAVGLAVAMPAVVLVNLIDRSVESLVADLDNMIAQVFNRDVARRGPTAESQRKDHALHHPRPAEEQA